MQTNSDAETLCASQISAKARHKETKQKRLTSPFPILQPIITKHRNGDGRKERHHIQVEHMKCEYCLYIRLIVGGCYAKQKERLAVGTKKWKIIVIISSDAFRLPKWPIYTYIYEHRCLYIIAYASFVIKLIFYYYLLVKSFVYFSIVYANIIRVHSVHCVLFLR